MIQTDNQNPTTPSEPSRYFDVHFFEYFPKVDSGSLSTEALLNLSIETIPFSDLIENDVSLIKSLNGNNSTLWGIKKTGDLFSIEYYFYFKKKYPKNALESLTNVFTKYSDVRINFDDFNPDYFLISINPDNKQLLGFNIYYPIIDNNYPVHHIEELGFTTNFSNAREISYYYDFNTQEKQLGNTYYGISSSAEMALLNKVFDSLCNSLFPAESVETLFKLFELPYLIITKHTRNVGIHIPTGIANKNDAIGFYFTALDIDQFIQFLDYHNYPDKLIQKIKINYQRFCHIRFDIGVDVYLNKSNLHIKKTSFYGSF